MFKKTKRIIGDLWEKIFKRKELGKYKTSALLLEKEVEVKDDVIKILTSGFAVQLTQNEVGMILNAIEHKPFRGVIELPATQAHIRMIWRDLRKKIKLHIKEDHEIKEDDETKEA